MKPNTCVMAEDDLLKDAIWSIRMRIREEENRHKLAVLSLQEELRRTQDTCRHSHKRFCMGTPYDSSYYTCDVCGKDDV